MKGLPLHNIARESKANRIALFEATSAKMGIHPAIIEKDFWVCVVLDYLFQHSPWANRLVFKGGTSLSKSYKLIQRFSEDIDLIIDWTLLGYSLDEPWQTRSKNKQDAFNMAMDSKAISFIAQTFVPVLRTGLRDWLGGELDISAEGQNVVIAYPKTFSLAAIHPLIFLEMGPRARWAPTKTTSIQPYAAEQYPLLFKSPSTEVLTVVAERTFWEKATILHQEANRSWEKALPRRYSRHYYDLYLMAQSAIQEGALSNIALLADVVEFKQRFYACGWAHFEEALRGSLRLQPPEYRREELRQDYTAMREMIFGDKPDFDDIIAALGRLEEQVNTVIREKNETAL